MPFSSAYLLVSHGSRDPRPQIALEHVARLVAQRLSARKKAIPIGGGNWGEGREVVLVGTAVLELAAPLPEQIQQFAVGAIASGYDSIKVVPLFLLAGMHVMEDLPIAVAEAQRNCSLKLELTPHLGSHPRIGELLIDPIATATAATRTGRVVIAHGSRRANSHQAVEAIAANLNAVPAYWSVPPSLNDRVTELIKSGYQQISILPYFLFEGGITDAIGQTVTQLQQQFPYAQLELGRSIGATAQLAELIVELLHNLLDLDLDQL